MKAMKSVSVNVQDGSDGGMKESMKEWREEM